MFNSPNQKNLKIWVTSFMNNLCTTHKWMLILYGCCVLCLNNVNVTFFIQFTLKTKSQAQLGVVTMWFWNFILLSLPSIKIDTYWKTHYPINIHELNSVCVWPCHVWMISETAHSSQTKLIGQSLPIGGHWVGYINLAFAANNGRKRPLFSSKPLKSLEGLEFRVRAWV